MFLAQHPVGYSTYVSCSKMKLAWRTILGSLTDTPHEFEVLDYSFRFFFELGVYCPLHKQQDMIVQLSVTSYVYHLETQEKVNNRLLG